MMVGLKRVRLKWRFWLIMRTDIIGLNKRGLVSNFIAFFGATIAIVLILLVFVLGASVVKKWNNAGADAAIFDEEMVKIDNIFSYSVRYAQLVEAKFLVVKGDNVDEALEESGYAK